jgi:uncharacterized membrane protein YkvA (DUF1232 family)
MKISLQPLYGLYSRAIRNPKYRYWIILGTLIYVLSPFDISPDVFPIAGQIDDFLLLSIMLTEVSQMLMTGYQEKKEKEKEKPSTKTVEVDAVSVD